jgi:hypothetical protein|tara:strand:- start:1439 stop:1936 length:498 start_codon:yes stop_codon:yes gene_type:complete
MSTNEEKQYTLIATLWYSGKTKNSEGIFESNAQYINVTTTPATENYHDIRAMNTSPDTGYESLGDSSTISYTGCRTILENKNSDITTPTFKEDFVISTPGSLLTGTSVYPDSGFGEITTTDKTIWAITGGTGIFQDANLARIDYDNKGFKFGIEYSRRVRVFKVE